MQESGLDKMEKEHAERKDAMVRQARASSSAVAAEPVSQGASEERVKYQSLVETKV